MITFNYKQKKRQRRRQNDCKNSNKKKDNNNISNTVDGCVVFFVVNLFSLSTSKLGGDGNYDERILLEILGWFLYN